MRKPADIFPLTAALADPSQSAFRVEDGFAESGISMGITFEAVSGFDVTHEVGFICHRDDGRILPDGFNEIADKAAAMGAVKE